MSDKKLRAKVIQTIWDAKEREISANDAYAQIKQAFAEAGYVSFAESHPLDFDKHSLMMTGAEWYRAFEKELQQLGEDESYKAYAVVEAARRAAGLETEGRG